MVLAGFIGVPHQSDNLCYGIFDQTTTLDNINLNFFMEQLKRIAERYSKIKEIKENIKFDLGVS